MITWRRFSVSSFLQTDGTGEEEEEEEEPLFGGLFVCLCFFFPLKLHHAESNQTPTGLFSVLFKAEGTAERERERE